MPITQQQINMLRAQMAPQPIIIQQQPQYFQTQNGQNISIPMNMQQPMFINASSLQQQPIQIHQQQPPQQVNIKEDSSND